MIRKQFAAELATLAGRLSLAQVSDWCAALDGLGEPDDATEARLLDAGPGPPGAAAKLADLWRRHAPRLPGAALSLALHTAALVHEDAERRRPRLVVTGPATSAVAVRLTSSVVVDVIRAATDRVLLVSFAAHGVTEVVHELVAAMDRGVAVDLVLESTQEHGGRLRAGAGTSAFQALADRATFWHWPARNRRNNMAALHAKVLVADAEVALLTSANFTDRGLADNIEIGVLLSDADEADRLDRHFRALMRPQARCLTRLEQ